MLNFGGVVVWTNDFTLVGNQPLKRCWGSCNFGHTDCQSRVFFGNVDYVDFELSNYPLNWYRLDVHEYFVHPQKKNATPKNPWKLLWPKKTQDSQPTSPDFRVSPRNFFAFSGLRGLFGGWAPSGWFSGDRMGPPICFSHKFRPFGFGVPQPDP